MSFLSRFLSPISCVEVWKGGWTFRDTYFKSTTCTHVITCIAGDISFHPLRFCSLYAAYPCYITLYLFDFFFCREIPFPLLTHEYLPAFAAYESMLFFGFLFFIILHLHFLSLSFVLVELGPAFTTVLFHPRPLGLYATSAVVSNLDDKKKSE